MQPALSCGYRFEDDALVDEMVAEVQRERGALPLLAFAASRLWEERDRETGLLTRQGLQGDRRRRPVLSHSTRRPTLERIGAQRIPLVRELFRNLVTAQGTRAVRERDELLSVFEADATTRSQAEDVLNALVDARLLTAYERAGEGGESHQQVEIIHESLLTAWPRLVRWQTQDADGAQLRDQLRQAAQLWHDRGQPEDLLWSGTAYRDFALWRERYPGGLTGAEEAFAEAMEANAARARAPPASGRRLPGGCRRRRRRRHVRACRSESLGVLAAAEPRPRRRAPEPRRASSWSSATASSRSTPRARSLMR